MRAGRLLTVGGVVLALTLGGCSSGDGNSARSGDPTTAGSDGSTTTGSGGSTTTGSGGPTTSAEAETKDLCATVNKLGKSVAALRSGSPEDVSQAELDAVQEDYEAFKSAAAGGNSVQAGQVGEAMRELEGTKGPEAADKLSQAYDRLSSSTNCP